MADSQFSRKDPLWPFLDRLAQRLKSYRENNGYSLDEVADEVGYASRSSILRLENGENLPTIKILARLSQLYGCSLKDLIGDLEEGTDSGEILFTRRTPVSKLLSDTSRTDIERGIDILAAVIAGKTIEEIYTLPHLSKFTGNPDVLFGFLRTALISGEISFTDIPQSKELERRLVAEFPKLKESVHVVNLPDTMISEALPPELVAWIAARKVLVEQKQPSRVGIGYGYTISRMCSITPPTTQQFNGTHWIPLITYSGKERNTIHSANYLSAMMEHRHFGSSATYLPYVLPSARPSHQGLEIIRRDWEQLKMAFVGGFPWSKDSSSRVALSFRTIYRELENTGQINNIAGEFLGYILDMDGNIIKEEQTSKATTQIPLEDIIRTVDKGKVYFVGGLKEKAHIVWAALKKGYINGLVTDSHLANALLKLVAPL